jgi:serpin B
VKSAGGAGTLGAAAAGQQQVDRSIPMPLARIVLGSLLLATCMVPVAYSEGSPVELKASAANHFGAKIFDRLAGGAASQSVVFSPFSLDAALDMLALGADGETAKRLNASLPSGRAVKTMAELQKSLASAQSEDVTFRSANALWLKDKAAARSSYVAAMQGVFDASVENANFSDPEAVKKVNGWVKQNTQNLIPQIVDRLDPRAELVLVNTIYFKGKWANPFDKQNTKPGPFTRADGSQHDVPMMNTSAQLAYAETPQWHAVKLPYGGNRFAMVIATARGEAKGSDVRRALGSADMFKTIADAPWQERAVNLALPRFRAEFGADLTDALSRQGLAAVFRPGANFGQMTNAKVRATSIIQRALVEVTEEGTEAAAATAVTATRSLDGPEPINFSADRPFVFAIVDQKTGMALFVGHIADPAS